MIRDVRIWTDRDGASPGEDLRDMIADYGCKGQRLGMEFHAYGLIKEGASTLSF